jgi:hypothetical protein
MSSPYLANSLSSFAIYVDIKAAAAVIDSQRVSAAVSGDRREQWGQLQVYDCCIALSAHYSCNACIQ